MLFTMQRLFTMFPARLPGIGLLLLRFSVAGMILALGRSYPAASFSGLLLPGEIAVATLLCIGYLTPPVASICCIFELLFLVSLFQANAVIFCVLTIMETLALALLGPGAYSLDARLFGRRLIRLPK